MTSLAGSGWLSPAGLRSMFPQQPGLKVAISPAEVSVGGCSSSRVGIVIYPSRSKTVVSPQSALVGLSPAMPQADQGQRRLSPAGVAYFPAAELFPDRVESECWRVPQQSASSSPEESLEGDAFFIHSSCR